MLIKLHIVSGCFYATVTEHQLNNLLFPLKRFPLKKKKRFPFSLVDLCFKNYIQLLLLYFEFHQ